MKAVFRLKGGNNWENLKEREEDGFWVVVSTSRGRSGDGRFT